MTIEFFEPMRIPSATHQEKQVAVIKGRPHFYEPQNVKDARAKYMAYLGKHAPAEPMGGAIHFMVAFEYHDNSIPKVKGLYKLKDTKPDTDNMVKLVKDCMTRLGYWHDDAQVCDEIVKKFWHGFDEGIYMKVVGE